MPPTTKRWSAQAIGTAGVVTGLWLHGRKLPLPKMSRLALHHVGGMVFVQVRIHAGAGPSPPPSPHDS